MKSGNGLISYLSPAVCPLCRINAAPDEIPFCDSCINELQALITSKCPHCGRAACACTCARPENSRALFFYGGGVSRRIIYYLKDGADKRAAEFLAGLLLASAGITVKRADAVTYVPRSKKRVRRSGCDQARMLAEAAAKILDLPLAVTLRRRGKGEQKTLGRKARFEHALTQYEANPEMPEELRGKRYLLFDDVTTTGATVAACAKLLRESGIAKTVTVLTLSMTDLKTAEGAAK
ncbi:MAG: ComF family protein [Clostridia bacterium]|nr:ComF family protein [Clostridia bacterium]